MKQISSGRKPGVAFLIACCIPLMASTIAEAYSRGEACYMKQTRDGFVALRKGPSAKSKLVHKMPYGLYRVAPLGPIRKWVKVNAAVPEDENGQYFSGEGYVFAKLIDWTTCGLAG